MNLFHSFAHTALIGCLGLTLQAGCAASPIVSFPGAACPSLDSGNFDRLPIAKDATDAEHLRSVLEAAHRYAQDAEALETELVNGCTTLSKALGASQQEVDAKRRAFTEPSKQICGSVTAAIEALLDAAPKAELSVQTSVAACHIDMGRVHACMSTCDKSADELTLHRSCHGTVACSVSQAPRCEGSCEGTCDGRCDKRLHKGLCKGHCEGRCQGICRTPPGKGCKGKIECRGQLKPEGKTARCFARCSAAIAEATSCQKSKTKIALTGQSAELTRVVKGLEKALPVIATTAQAKVQAMLSAYEPLAAQLDTLNASPPNVGGEAQRCLAAAAQRVGEARAQAKLTKQAGASLLSFFDAPPAAESSPKTK